MSYNTNDTRCLCLCPVTTLVNKSSGLSSDLICPVNVSPIATDLRMAYMLLHYTFLQCWVWLWGGMDNKHVISINVWGPRYGNTHYPQIILDRLQGFYSNFHGSKLCTTYWCLYGRLFLRIPVNKQHVHADHEHGPRSSSKFVASKIAVYDHT